MKTFSFPKYGWIVCLLLASVAGYSQVTNNFESGNKTYYEGLCWAFSGSTVNSSQPIAGSASGRTDQLSGATCTFTSPWVLFSGSGMLSFKHRIYNFNGTFRKLRVYVISFSNPTGDTIYSYDYSSGSTISVDIPMTQSGLYKVIWLYKGAGGNSRGQVDDISIPGTYSADPSNGCSAIQPNPDTDGDGVPNTEDDYPLDFYRAYDNFYPSSGQSTLAFEDLWPSRGDYDLNDVVIGYNFQVVSNASHNVVELFGKFVLRASGAGLHNGFGFQLPGVGPTCIISTTGYDILPGAGFTIGSNGLETGQTYATVIVFDDFFRFLVPSGGGVGVNTSLGQTPQPYDTLNITMVFMNNGTPGPGGAVNINTLNIAGFNPFIIAGMVRGKEIHLPNYLPTSKADTAYFGDSDDDTNPAAGKYYKTTGNLPWALNIYEEFDYPLEEASIVNAYLKFATWVQSNGVQYPDWYQNNPGYRDVSKIY